VPNITQLATTPAAAIAVIALDGDSTALQDRQYAVIVLLAVAMGLRNVTVRQLAVPGLTTTTVVTPPVWEPAEGDGRPDWPLKTLRAMRAGRRSSDPRPTSGPVRRSRPPRHPLPGLVALVASGDDVHVEAIGHKAFGDVEPIARDAIFRIASITKPIAGAAAMLLVEDGAMALDDPIEREIPAFRALDMRQVTLAHVVRQRLVGSLPKRRAQASALQRVQLTYPRTYPRFGSGFHVGFHHVLEDSPGRAEQQTMNSHLSHKKNSSHP